MGTGSKIKGCIIILFFILILSSSLSLTSGKETSLGKPILHQDYKISRDRIERRLGIETIFKDFITISNLKDQPFEVVLEVTGEAKDLMKIESKGFMIKGNSSVDAILEIYGKKLGSYDGYLEISGDINERIPIHINVTEKLLSSRILLKVTTPKREFNKNELLKVKIDVTKLIATESYNVSFSYGIKGKDNFSYQLEEETLEVKNSFPLLKEFKLPEIESGEYFFEVRAEYLNISTSSMAGFLIKKPFLSYLVFGIIPVWTIITGGALITAFIFLVIILKKFIARKKKYKGKVDFKTLPKKTANSIWLGKIAETNIKTYLDMNQLLTHTIVAGATGGGKSISAQVIIEEALLKGSAVVVFDPTAQWSGMLRKCEDKNMLKYYHQFGLKPSDARAFNGNIKQINNPREFIDIKRYIKPGEIQIFSINKLEPKDIDIFISNIINTIFKANLPESPELKLLLVYDEVHRLLSRFGGSGEGFIQLERACREFRKWGIGILLISQVLSDFVGEIKANINTEIQTRTIDEGDLERIKTKYGSDILRSLVRGDVGIAMIQNSEYNRGRPYFVNFRPILHNTRRLSDEELEKYNKYNAEVDELDWQIEQLEKEGVDVFDLRMELKLVLDKIKSGSFNVVDIYLEGLKPRIEREWEKLGKKAKPREGKTKRAQAC
jgi:hypothetical protein